MTMDAQALNRILLYKDSNMENIVTELALMCTVFGGVIGYIVGYRHGSSDVEKVYKDVYEIKDYS